jgi:prepilin-type N-terminal cleavage/methylation domain-containing protein
VATKERSTFAFTLIELLVVISVISLLVALLLPALRQARDAGHQAHSLAQVRQIFLALYSYGEDHQRHPPFGRVPITVPVPALGMSWAQTLRTMSYVTSERIYWSPGRDTSAGNYAYLYPGYGLNWGLDTTRFAFDAVGTPDPSRMIALAETWHWVNDLYGTRPGYWEVGGQNSAVANGGNPMHWRLYSYNGGVTRAYVDGHASAGDRDCGWKADANSFGGGNYGGDWTYTHHTQWYYTAPWYQQWWVGIQD